MNDTQRSYERFVDVTTPLLLQHYERIRKAAETDEEAQKIFRLYGSIYQTFDVAIADALYDALVAWLTAIGTGSDREPT